MTEPLDQGKRSGVSASPSPLVVVDSDINAAPPSAEVVTGGSKKAAKKLLRFRKPSLKKGVLPAVHAMKLRDAAVAAEPRMTALLVGLSKKYDGDLVGLDYRIKTPESLKQKIERDIREANLKVLEAIEQRRQLDDVPALPTPPHMKHPAGHPRTPLGPVGEEDEAAASPKIDSRTQDAEALALEAGAEKDLTLDIEKIVWSVSDILRYTVLFSTERYTEAVRSAVATLGSVGVTHRCYLKHI